MPPDPRAYVWDAHRAVSLVMEFVTGRSWADYEADVQLRSAVERQFTIVGEALNSLRRVDEELAERVPDLARIVAFGNVLILGYAAIDDRLVWEVATERAPAILDALEELPGGSE
ncbi:MAG: DUF86 domain-containing protein [Acidimicrobiia bacterium]|nr:DUF86 domain-containing protein [Acidimicrobiia bacterium]